MQKPIAQEVYDADFWNGKLTNWWIYGVDEDGKRKSEGKHPYIIMNEFGGKGIRVLDAGCGMGFLVKFLRELEIIAFGIDYSEYAIKNSVAKDFVILGDMTKLPFDDSSFDLVISRENFEHLTVEQAEQAFKEMFRVTKKWLYLTIWINQDPSASDTEVLTDLEKDPTHITFCTKNFWLNKFKGYIDDGKLIRREDKEKILDWKGKGRCFVFEKIR